MRTYGPLLLMLAVACGARSELEDLASAAGGEAGQTISGGASGQATTSGGTGGLPPASGGMQSSGGAQSSGGTGGAGGAERCLYLLTREDSIYRLRLETMDLPEPRTELVGHLDCIWGSNSMAVSDAGIAYVNTSAGQLVPVDLATARCLSDVELVPAGPGGLGLLRTPDGSEHLYLVEGEILYGLTPLSEGICCPIYGSQIVPDSLVGWNLELADSEDADLYAFYPRPDQLGSQATVERFGTTESVTFDVGGLLSNGFSYGWDAVHVDDRVLAFLSRDSVTMIYTLATNPLTYVGGAQVVRLGVIGVGIGPCG